VDSATLNYFLIFKTFFMKKLVFAMGCFAAILLTSSCTADSPVDTAKENLLIPTKVPSPRTEVFADDLDNPIPPKK
jgi:hypothetical protein